MSEDGKLEMQVTQLIGLGEVKRNIYLEMRRNGYLNGTALSAFQSHEKQQELLIKYQKYLMTSP